jgi:hypothetical protein
LAGVRNSIVGVENPMNGRGGEVSNAMCLRIREGESAARETDMTEPERAGPSLGSTHSRLCPDCGGRVLEWSFDRVCTSCRRRFPLATGDPRDMLGRHGWEPAPGVGFPGEDTQEEMLGA